MSLLDKNEGNDAIDFGCDKSRVGQLSAIFTAAFLAFAVTITGVSQNDVSSFTARLVERLTFGGPIEANLERKSLRDWDLDKFIAAYMSDQESDSWVIGDHLHGSAPKRTDPRSKIGVYLTASSVRNDAILDYTFRRLEETGGNAIIFDVKGSHVYFKTDSPLANGYDLVRPIYDLPGMVRRAKDRGFYTMARFIAVKDPVFSSTVPEVQIRHPVSRRSVGSVWVDPAHPITIEYNRQVVEDIVASGIDEINLDYIRYPTEYSLGSIGLTGEQKADRLVRFIKMVRDEIEKRNADTVLGISTFAILGWNFPVNFEPLGQDIARLAPYVDIVSPMAYPSTFSRGGYYNPAKHPVSRNYWLVYRTMEGYKELLGKEHEHKLRPWIQGYFMQTKGLRDQIRAVYDSGSCGFKVWSAQNKYDALYAAMRDVKQPEHCLVTSGADQETPLSRP